VLSVNNVAHITKLFKEKSFIMNIILQNTVKTADYKERKYTKCKFYNRNHPDVMLCPGGGGWLIGGESRHGFNAVHVF